jgi:hypothetical protein
VVKIMQDAEKILKVVRENLCDARGVNCDGRFKQLWRIFILVIGAAFLYTSIAFSYTYLVARDQRELATKGDLIQMMRFLKG